eukprot:5854623-Prymnesium_polylepis.1
MPAATQQRQSPRAKTPAASMKPNTNNALRRSSVVALVCAGLPIPASSACSPTSATLAFSFCGAGPGAPAGHSAAPAAVSRRRSSARDELRVPPIPQLVWTAAELEARREISLAPTMPGPAPAAVQKSSVVRPCSQCSILSRLRTRRCLCSCSRSSRHHRSNRRRRRRIHVAGARSVR